METKGSHKHPIVRTINEAYPPQLTETDSATGITYTGWAKISSADTSKPVWKIQKKTVTTVATTTTTKIEWPNSDDEFNYKWDDRATLAYSM